MSLHNNLETGLNHFCFLIKFLPQLLTKIVEAHFNIKMTQKVSLHFIFFCIFSEFFIFDTFLQSFYYMTYPKEVNGVGKLGGGGGLSIF